MRGTAPAAAHVVNKEREGERERKNGRERDDGRREKRNRASTVLIGGAKGPLASKRAREDKELGWCARLIRSHELVGLGHEVEERRGKGQRHKPAWTTGKR